MTSRPSPRPSFPLTALLLPLALAACGTTTASPVPPRPRVAVTEARTPAPPGATEDVVVLDTSLGRMVVGLFPEAAPRTVAQFERLVREGFYDGLPFYRVVAGHVAQAGDGGENDQPTVPAEFNDHPHVVGAVGLARDEDPDSGSTELYICLAPRPHLDGRYTVFGQVVEGLDVVARIGAVEVEEKWLDDEHTVAFHEPKTPVLIEHARVERRPPAEGAR